MGMAAMGAMGMAAMMAASKGQMQQVTGVCHVYMGMTQCRRRGEDKGSDDEDSDEVQPFACDVSCL